MRRREGELALLPLFRHTLIFDKAGPNPPRTRETYSHHGRERTGTSPNLYYHVLTSRSFRLYEAYYIAALFDLSSKKWLR